MKVLFDTNIILDVLLDRKQFVVRSANLVSMAENKQIEGFLCATTITTIDYLIAKAHNRVRAKAEIQKLLNIHYISEVNEQVLGLAINSHFKDFEDAVQYYSGECIGVDCLVTRNLKDYKGTQLAVYSPEELLSIIKLQT
ncbi:MAG: PIN domain-containing protein [Thiotrichaceae bacterium]